MRFLVKGEIANRREMHECTWQETSELFWEAPIFLSPSSSTSLRKEDECSPSLVKCLMELAVALQFNTDYK